MTQTGTVDTDACDYAAIFMTKTAGKISETDYHFDSLIMRRGKIHNIIYYTNYPWRSNSGTYKEDSTLDDDVLNVGADEYNIIVEKCVETIGMEVREYEDSAMAGKRYEKRKQDYLMTNPSEALVFTNTYYDYGSQGSDSFVN
jgi:hypothetical protein